MEEWRRLPCRYYPGPKPRTVWKRLFGDPGPLLVLHRCNHAACKEPTHWYLGTHRQNTKDSLRDNPDHASNISRGISLFHRTGLYAYQRRALLEAGQPLPTKPPRPLPPPPSVDPATEVEAEVWLACRLLPPR